MEEVVSVYNSKGRYYLQTTRSWEFVGLEEELLTQESKSKNDLLSRANYGEDIIVGMIDSGKSH